MGYKQNKILSISPKNSLDKKIEKDKILDFSGENLRLRGSPVD